MSDYQIKDNKIRNDYVKTLEDYIRVESEICKKNRNELINRSESVKRSYLIEMLGRPLNKQIEDGDIEFLTKKEVYSDEQIIAEEYTFVLFGVIKFSGWLLKKQGVIYDKNNKKSFIIALHGGGGSPERATGIYIDTANYNNIANRFLTQDTVVFVPQLMLWNPEVFGTPYNREILNRRLIQQGGSFTALELTFLMRIVDYYSKQDYIDKSKIGVAGLSYGGMYSLYLGAIDKRIKVIYTSCWFNDRSIHNWHDWTYFNAENMLFDSEVASIVLPRRLFIEIGEKDPTFKMEQAKSEIERIKNYADKNCKGQLTIIYSQGEHEFNKDNKYVEEFLQYLIK